MQAAPLYVPAMPRTGKQMSVRMTNCGPLGWVTDKDRGYRYQPTHPVTGEPWPPIPDALLALWREVAGYPHPPEACLVNFYDATREDGPAPGPRRARISTRRSSRCRSATIACSASAGPAATARPTPSGCAAAIVVVLGGEGRLAFHGVDRIYPATSTLLKNGGRINLTLRRVTKPA